MKLEEYWGNLHLTVGKRKRIRKRVQEGPVNGEVTPGRVESWLTENISRIKWSVV